MSDSVTIKFCNWEQYNKRAKEYKNPVWFSFQNDFATNRNFYDFTDQQRLIFIYLLCEASQQNKAGSLTIEVEHFCYHTRQKPKDVHATIEKLKQKQILEARDRDGIVAGSCGDRDLAVTEQNRTIHTLSAPLDGVKAKISEADEGGFDLEAIYEAYPRRKGDQRKRLGLKRLQSLIKTEADFELAMRAVKGYKAHLMGQNKIGTEFVKMFSSFWDPLGDWKAWAQKPERNASAEINDDLIIKAFGYIPGGVDA